MSVLLCFCFHRAENQAIIKKKLDDAVAKNEELKQSNAVLSGKVIELNEKNEQVSYHGKKCNMTMCLFLFVRINKEPA